MFDFATHVARMDWSDPHAAAEKVEAVAAAIAQLRPGNYGNLQRELSAEKPDQTAVVRLIRESFVGG